MLEDAELLMRTDEAHAACVLQGVIARLLHGHARLHRQWPAKAKHAFADMSAWDPVGAELFRLAHVGDLAARLSATKDLLQHCLRDIGGPMARQDWCTGWRAYGDARTVHSHSCI
jgi:hypothetical protein